LRRSEDFIVERLENAGLPAYVFEHSVEFHARGQTIIRNIYSYIPGTSDRSVIFIAHYDSFPFSPGAMDNAVATATLLESFIDFYRRVGTPEIGIQILFTDGHEFGFGALQFVFYHGYLVENTIFALNFDGFGYGLITPLRGGAYFAHEYFQAVSRPTGFSILAYGAILDEWPFAHVGIPAMTLMASGRIWNYHLPGDTIENLDIRTFHNYLYVIYNMMNRMTQAAWADSFAVDSTTYFMLGYNVFISYGTVIRWIIAAVAVASLVAFVVLRKSKLDLTGKGIAISVLGIGLFVVLYIAVAIGIHFLLGLIGLRINNHITNAVTLAVILPFASYFYYKGLSRFVSRDSLGVSVAFVFSIMGIVIAVIMPGLEYFLSIVAILVVVRLWIPQSKVLYYVTGSLTGILFFPLLFIMTKQMGMASPLSTLLFSLFISAFYVLSKEYPAISKELNLA
jgi:hypothetical protein